MIAREHPVEQPRDQHVVEMRHQKQGIVNQIVEWRKGEENPGKAAQHECHHEGERVEHRHGKPHLPAKHCPNPIVDLDARGHANRHRCDAEHGIDVGILAHGEEVMDPHRERQQRDCRSRQDERGVAVELLAGESGDNLRIDAEGRQDEDVDLRMPEQPEKVGVVHHVAAEVIREEMEPQIAVEREQRGRDGQRRHREDHQDAGAQRRPHEQRHPHHIHAGTAHLIDRYGEIDPRQRRSNRAQRDRPDPVIDPDARTEGEFGIRRIAAPPAGREFANDERHHHQPGRPARQPQAD